MTPIHPRQPNKASGSTTLVLVALGLALVAVVLINIYIEAIRRSVRLNSFHAYVLTRPVLPGDKLRREDVKEVTVPKEFEESFRSLNAVDDNEMETKFKTAEPVLHAAGTGDIVMDTLFQQDSRDRNLDQAITPGKRLISLPVDSRRVPGELRPGIYVDIQAAFNTGGAVPVVLPVMEYVKVTAVGTRTINEERESDPGRNRPLGGYRAISIEVTEDEAVSLDTIQRVMIGDFTLLLRNPADSSAAVIKAGGINPEVLDLIHRRAQEPGRRN